MSKNITKLKHRFPLKQLRHLGHYFARIWPVFALLTITSLLIFLNYEPGTTLTGWDNLHPEYNLTENLRRAFSAVWQQHRGLGLLGGMAEAADLPRTLLVALLLAIKIPVSLIRYLTTFLPLILGPLGVYFLFYHHLFKGKLDAKTTQFASFLGSLYYLLNLNTLQTFFVPFETFTWFYGFLPWLLYVILNYLLRPSPLRLFTLFIISFFSAPSFYVETIFLVFFVVLLPFFIEFLHGQKNRLKHLRTSFFSLVSLLIPHLFWLLPIAFFVLTQGHIPEQAKNNLLSSPETYARNLQFATIKDTALLKGYLFNYLDIGQDGKYTYLMTLWRNHLDIPVVKLLGFLSFILIATGFYYSFKKKFTWTKSFVGVLTLCLFFLLGGGLLVNNKIPLIGELFRSPFTKFSIPLSLTYSFFFSIGTIFLLDLFSFLHSRFTYLLTIFTVTFSLIIFMSPAFSGNLIYPSMRQVVPQEYHDLFAYMNTQDHNTRVANFPQFSFWGWESYHWGYRGSGFLWYGLPQSLLDRAFDVWDKNSENYYQEISTALYSGNQKQFEQTLDKYSVNWLLLDDQVTLVENATDSGYVTLKQFLTHTSKISLDKQFGDKLSLYKVTPSKPVQNYLSLGTQPTANYPFSSLSLRPNTSWTTKGGFINLTKPVIAHQNDTITIPSLTASETLIPVRVAYRKLGSNLDIHLMPVIPTIFLDNSQIDLQANPITVSIPGTVGTGFILSLNQNYYELQLPAEIETFSDFYPLTTVYLPTQKAFNIALYSNSEINTYDLTDSLSEANPTQCYTIKPNHKVEKLSTPTGVSLIGTDVVGCLSAPLPYIPQGNLLSLAFTYSSPTLTSANVNISGKDLQAVNLPQPQQPEEKPTRTRIFTPSTGSFQQVNLILEAGETKSVREINYDHVEVTVLPSLFSTSVSLPVISEKQIHLKNDIQRLQISLPQTETQFDLTETPTNNSLFPENLNCDQFNDGSTVKQVTADGFLYQSQNAIECDSLSLRHLPHSLSYLLSFDYRFQRGLPTTICLENHTSRRCDVQERLINSNKLQSVIQPITNQTESPGYTLHLYTQSFGTRSSSSLIKSISIRPLPLQFIQNISVTSPQTDTAAATLNSSSHHLTFLYTASVKADNNQTQLNLYQSQSPSWKAFKVASDDLKMPSWLISVTSLLTAPFLTQLPHNDTGLWYNSWTLSQGENNLIIVYLPQYLEFFGLSLLVLVPLFALLYFFLKRSPSTSHRSK